MGYIKPSSQSKNPDNWEKMGQVCFVSSISTAPTFSKGGEKIIHSPLLQAGKANYVSPDERINATIWRCKNQ